MKAVIKNGRILSGGLRLPPSKSEAIRAALLLYLAGSQPQLALSGYEGSRVCGDIAAAVESCVQLKAGGTVYVGGSAALLRMLLPVSLAKFGRADIVMERRLAQRGFGEFEACFGVKASYENGRLRMEKRLEPGRYAVDCSRSSQFLSGLLLALPLLEGESVITPIGSPVSKSYANMTLAYAQLFGARFSEGFVERGMDITAYPSRYTVPAPPYRYEDGRCAFVSGDCSYAAFFRAAGLIGPGISMTGVSSRSLQPDIAFSSLVGAERVSMDNVPDLLPPLAAAACILKYDAVFTGTGRLKHKESSRAEKMAELIRDLGGSAEAREDELAVCGSHPIRGGECDPNDDHRLAMAAAVLASVCTEPVILKDPLCVNKSAPDFWHDYTLLGGEYEFIR